MIKAKQFSHCAVRVGDAPKSMAFYEQVLGLKKLPRPDFGFPGAWYGVGDNAIHLISERKSRTQTRPARTASCARRRRL